MQKCVLLMALRAEPLLVLWKTIYPTAQLTYEMRMHQTVDLS